MNYYTFKNGLFTLRVPGKNEEDARKALPDSFDYGEFNLVSVECADLRRDE